MKKTVLSRIPDNGIFKLSESGVSYTRIKKVKEGIVINSNKSGRSYVKKGKDRVYLM